VRYLKSNVRLAKNDELEELGLIAGFISPVQNSRIPFIADNSVKNLPNAVTGANKDQTDFINVNIGRDYQIADFADLVEVDTKIFSCEKCGGELLEAKAVEAGNIFKLGTKYSESIDLKFTNREGQEQLAIMGCYGIGTTRLLGTIVEASHDEKGIIWPKTVAPFQVHLLTLGKSESTLEVAEKIYSELQKHNIEVLFDDRQESAGKKFNDADLIGLPIRVLISDKTLSQNQVELKMRQSESVEMINLDDLFKTIRQKLND
jgi:prolyl-tRNA synthetase